MNDLLTFRKAVLADLGADDRVLQELLHYNQNQFHAEHADSFTYPLSDEAFIPVWEEYAQEVEEADNIGVLAKYLVQLQFPVQQGMSQQAAYIAATRQGIESSHKALADGLQLCRPDRCRVLVHPTNAGRIPLLIAEKREDFVSLVRALARRNEPVPIPASMGACIVAGYNNWNRISRLRSRFYASGANPDTWPAEFQKIKSERDLYQDRFVILSSGPYSGVDASELGLSQSQWSDLSLVIRREHECAHYFSRRVFASMRNNLLDELIADYFGISAATGRFRADWLLTFLGVESFPEYHHGRRLENYRGDPRLSDAAFSILQRLVVAAAVHLESFDLEFIPEWQHLSWQPALYVALARLTVEQMAAPDGKQILADNFRAAATGGFAPEAVPPVLAGCSRNSRVENEAAKTKSLDLAMASSPARKEES